MEHQGPELLFPALNQCEFSHRPDHSAKSASEPAAYLLSYCFCYSELPTQWLSHQWRSTSPQSAEPVRATLYTWWSRKGADRRIARQFFSHKFPS